MTKVKPTEKTKYRTIQVPETLVELTLELIPGLYRNHHEAMIEWIRLGLYELIHTRYKMKKTLKKT
ncbi:MAG: hypothetical protein ACFFFT_00300 [Candidatus Thorarchaeota archaeon]